MLGRRESQGDFSDHVFRDHVGEETFYGLLDFPLLDLAQSTTHGTATSDGESVGVSAVRSRTVSPRCERSSSSSRHFFAVASLLYDNDSRPTQSQALGKLRLPAIFSEKVTEAIEDFRVQPKRTAYRSPWQNGTAERWIGSARREQLDHVIVFDELHLRRLLRDYVAYYNADRAHTELRDSPVGRQIERRPSANAAAIGLLRVGGLHHRDIW